MNSVPGREDLTSLTYTTMCIKEAIRIHCPVPTVGRDTNEAFELEGITLLPGTFIDVSIHLLHHNPDVWGDDHMVESWFLAKGIALCFNGRNNLMPPKQSYVLLSHLILFYFYLTNLKEFRPERFDPREIDKMDPFAFVPFSAGPRQDMYFSTRVFLHSIDYAA